ncbi:MAG: hypothetical protein JW819_05810 [Candidatus Krumholzibacteriota bacterium]|nr:hypothetical protein [Candidatus Krumholzibacteriota bacterium]
MAWHQVASDERIETIAERYGLTPDELLDLMTPLGETNREGLGRDEAYPGEHVWVPDPPEDEDRGGTDEESGTGDRVRDVVHAAGGTEADVADAGGGSGGGGTGGAVTITVTSPPWERPDLNQWLRWQEGLSSRHADRISANDEALYCARAYGERILWHWGGIHGRTWSFGAETTHNLPMGTGLWRCCLGRTDISAADALRIYREQNRGHLPGTDRLGDGGVRYAAFRNYLRSVGEDDAMAAAFSWSTSGSPVGQDVSEWGRTLDPQTPYYAPVARIRNLLARNATLPQTWVDAPLQAQLDVTEILFGILARGTRHALGAGVGVTTSHLDGILGGMRGDSSTGHRAFPHINVSEFHRTARLSGAQMIRDRLSSTRVDVYDRILEIMDICIRRYPLRHLDDSATLRSRG